MQASVAIALALDSVFVCVNARGHVGRSQQQLLQLVRKRIGEISWQIIVVLVKAENNDYIHN